jgi:hypothetical protein
MGITPERNQALSGFSPCHVLHSNQQLLVGANCFSLQPIGKSPTHMFGPSMQVKASRQAFKVSLIYISAAGAYILLSNELVKELVSDPDQRVNITILKGWIFVLVTGALLGWTLRRLLGGWAREVAHGSRGRQRCGPGQASRERGTIAAGPGCLRRWFVGPESGHWHR